MNDETEYIQLKTYTDNAFTMRGILLKSAMSSIIQIDENRFSIPTYSESENETKSIRSSKDKIMYKSIFQMEVIAQIMLYVEDLIILSESFRSKTAYYKLLDQNEENKRDVGDIVDCFLKNMNSFSNETFSKIFGYVDPNRLDMEKNEQRLVEKIIQTNISKYRNGFDVIRKFSETHHPIFRRFKHACTPVALGIQINSKDNGFFSKFDSCTMVATGFNAMEDSIPIPLSSSVLQGYETLIVTIQTILTDLLENHKTCLKRNLNGVIPIKTYCPNDFSDEETMTCKEIVKKFYEKYPLDDTPRNIHYLCALFLKVFGLSVCLCTALARDSIPLRRWSDTYLYELYHSIPFFVHSLGLIAVTIPSIKTHSIFRASP